MGYNAQVAHGVYGSPVYYRNNFVIKCDEGGSGVKLGNKTRDVICGLSKARRFLPDQNYSRKGNIANL